MANLQVYDPFEDELKRRMAAAKQQGWSDNDINRSALVERAMNSRQKQQSSRDAQVQKQQSSEKKKPSGWKKFAINAGAIGAETAAGLGAVLAAPVTGGASLAGGFAAGAGIEALRRKMLGEHQSAGASLLEGGLTIIPVVGQANKLRKGAQLTKDAAEVAQSAKVMDATKRTAEIVPKKMSSPAPNQTPFNFDTAFKPGVPVRQQAAQPTLADISQAANKRPGAEIQTAIEHAHNTGDTAGASRLIEQLPENMRDSTRRALGIEAPAPAALTPPAGPTNPQSFMDDVRKMFTKSDEGIIGAPGRAVERAGDATRAGGRGVVPGLRAEGAPNVLRTKDAKEVNAYIDANAKGSVGKQLETIGSKRQEAADNLTNVLEKHNRPLQADEIQGVKTEVMSRLGGVNGKGIPGYDPRLHAPITEGYDRLLGSATDLKGMNNFKRSLDGDVINYGRSSASADPIREQIAKEYRKVVSERLKTMDATGEIGAANKAFAQAVKAEDALVKSKKLSPSNSMSSLTGMVLNGKPTQAVQDFIGRAAQKTGRVASTPVAQTAGAQVGIHAFTNPTRDAMGAQPPGEAPIDPNAPLDNPGGFQDAQPGSDEEVINALMSSGVTDFDTLAQGLTTADQMKSEGGFNVDNAFGGAAPAGAPDTGLGYSSDELFQAAISAFQAGDSKSSDQFMQLAQFAKDKEDTLAKSSAAAGGNGLNVSKVTSQQYGLAQTGSQSLQALKQLISEDPNVVARGATPGGSLPVVGGYIRNAAGVGQYDALGYNIADALIRLRTGATANESEIKGYANKIMPRAGDTPQVVALKLKQLEDSFGSIMNLAGQQPTTPDFNDFAGMFGEQQQQQYAY